METKTNFRGVGVALMAVSAFAFVWGVNYTSSGANTVFAQLPGNQDSTYQIAQICVYVGPVVLLFGLLVLLVGLRRNR